jgi:hypothetical protein
MKSRSIVFFTWLVLLLAGCERITEGIVVDKRYMPAHTSIQLTPVYINRTIRTIPRPVYHAESWTITIQATAKEKEHRRNFKVTQEIFERIKIGDFFSATDNEPLDTSQGEDGGAV